MVTLTPAYQFARECTCPRALCRQLGKHMSACTLTPSCAESTCPGAPSQQVARDSHGKARVRVHPQETMCPSALCRHFARENKCPRAPSRQFARESRCAPCRHLAHKKQVSACTLPPLCTGKQVSACTLPPPCMGEQVSACTLTPICTGKQVSACTPDSQCARESKCPRVAWEPSETPETPSDPSARKRPRPHWGSAWSPQNRLHHSTKTQHGDSSRSLMGSSRKHGVDHYVRMSFTRVSDVPTLASTALSAVPFPLAPGRPD